MDEDGVLAEAAELAKARELSSCLRVEALREMDEKRRAGRRLPVRPLDVGFPLEEERVGPAVAPHDAHRESLAELAVERVVVRNGRDSREEVLQPADEQAIAKRVGPAFANGWIFIELRAHVVDPGGGVVVRVAELHAAEVVQLEMVVSVQKPRENERAFDVDHDVRALGGPVDSENPGGKPDGRTDSPFGDDSGVDQRYRALPHESFTS